MIDPHWSLVDLDPHTWRTIGRFFDPGQYVRAARPDARGLFVLHDGGRVLRVVDTQLGVRRDLELGAVESPAELAEQLFARGEWQRVHIIDRRHLAAVAREAQATPRRDLTLDQYYRLVYQLVWDGGTGYVSVPPHPGRWQGWTYADLATFVASLPDPATLALVVLDGPATGIGLILDLRDGSIRLVTTLETFGFPAPTFDLSAASFDRLWSMLEERNATPDAPPPAAALLCSRLAFETLLAAEDKPATLLALAAQGQAFWRLRDR